MPPPPSLSSLQNSPVCLGLMVLLRCNFSVLHFYTLSKILIACRVMQLRFVKVKTLLNNAFKCKANKKEKKHFITIMINISSIINFNHPILPQSAS